VRRPSSTRAPAPWIVVGEDFEDEYPGADRLATECYANIVRTGHRLSALHDRQAWEDHRLSGTAKQALAVLEGAGEPLEPSVIAERLIITTGSMTSMLNTLERSGLVGRMPHPSDRRKLLVGITPKGAAIVNDLLPSFHSRERVILADALSKAEQRQLRTLLARIQASIDRHADDPPDRTTQRITRSRPRTD
jgi:MarR family transcriptional regulator, 2-MHQ and catechol-resistance regulon repressor